MPDYNAYTVGWICAVEPELVAASELLDEEEEEPVETPVNDNNNYTLGRIGKHHVVIAALPLGQYGLTSAANVGRDMVRTFPNIRIGLMVGIGGGVPTKHDIRLGDVVVSSSSGRSGGVIQYDYGTAMQGQGLVIKGALNQAPISIQTAMSTLSARHQRRGHKLEQAIQAVLDKNPRLLSQYQRPNSDTDRLYKADFIHAARGTSCVITCDETNTIPRDARSADEDNPKIFYGLIASGNQLMKDAAVRDRLSAEEEVLCFEMEAAGLSNHFPCVVIRGICDYSDSHKNDAWQGYAAMVAAAYAKELLLQISPYKVEAEKKIGKIEELLVDVIGPISKTKEDVGALKLNLDKEDNRKVLDWLTQVDYTSQQNDFMEQHQQGTGQWFLKSEKFQTWLKTKNATLFCPGMPGAGKTITTAIVISHLYSELGDNQTIGIAYVYCNFQRRNEQGAGQLLSSLLKQLARGLSSLPEALKALYKRHEDRRTEPSIEEISQTLQAVVRLYSTVFIIIDALDECQTNGGCQTTFLSEVRKLRDQTGANIFVTSRPSNSLEKGLRECLVQEIYAHDEDVMSYIDYRTAQMMVLNETNEDLEADEKEKLRILIRDEVSEAVNGIFLLARFHLDYLKDKTTPNQISNALEELPTGPMAYDEAYGKTIMRIRNQEEGFRNLAKKVLTWLTYARRRLTTPELRHALAVQVGCSALDEGNLESTNVITHVCMGLVKIEKGSDTISLLHYTTMEYLQSNTGCLSSLDALTPMDDTMIYAENGNETARRHGQTEIAKICATYLSFSAFKSGCCYEGLEERLKSHPFYDYAAQNWGHHALEAHSSCKEVKKFLKSKAHVAASSEVLMTHMPELDLWTVHRQMTALHLAAYFGLEEEFTDLLDYGMQPDAKDTYGRTPLSYAAENGFEAVVETLLITDGVDPDSKDRNDRNPLSHAAEQGHASVVRLLLESGRVDPESEDNDGQGWICRRTALSYAAGRGHEDVVSLLLGIEGVNVDSKTSGSPDAGQTPLSFAAEAGHEAVVRLLLATKRVDVESRSGEAEQTPLSYAAENGHEAVVSLLLATEAVEPDSESTGYSAGRTPLSFAAGAGHEAIVDLLLRTPGVDPDSKSTGYSAGRTPLSFAAGAGREAIVDLLLKTPGVDPDSNYTHDLAEQTPLSYAVENRHHVVARLLLADDRVNPDSRDSTGWTPLLFATVNQDEVMVKLLLETKGVRGDSKIADYDWSYPGSTALSIASQQGNATVVRMLLAKDGIDPDSRDSNGRTPLSHAAEQGCEEEQDFEMVIMMLLQQQRVDPDSRGDDGRTPLSHAAYHGYETAVRLLLARDEVDPDSRDSGGRTPLFYAVFQGAWAQRKFLPIIKMLLEKEGVDPDPKDDNGLTPLYIAVRTGNKALARLLLVKNGQDPDLRDKDGLTRLDWIMKNGV